MKLEKFKINKYNKRSKMKLSLNEYFVGGGENLETLEKINEVIINQVNDDPKIHSIVTTNFHEISVVIHFSAAH